MCFALLILGSGSLFGQVSGTKTIPTDYATIAAFITDINTNGIGAGGVTLNVPSGYTETAPAGGFSITATGTVADPIIIQGTGGAPKPVITASGSLTSGALNDGIIKLIGSDYVTISGLDLRENAANTTTTAASNNMTEWGIALLYATTTNGAQNCTISANDITLSRTYQNTFGIYSNSTHSATAVTTSATATTAAGGNSGLKIYSNVISNVNNGILVVGPTAGADANAGVDIGGSSAGTGNTISNFGNTGTFSGFANVSGSVFGILVRNSSNVNASFNSVSSAAHSAGTIRGIFFQASSGTASATTANTCSNNTINMLSGSAGATVHGIFTESASFSTTSSIAINSNNFTGMTYSVAGTGAMIAINNTLAVATTNINSNTFTNIVAATTGSFTFIVNNASRPANAISNTNNNSISGTFSKSSAGGTVTFYNSNSTSPTSVTEINTGNNFSNITVTGATTIAGWGSTDGSTSSPYGPAKTITNNTFSNITGGTNAVTLLNVAYSNANTGVTNDVSGNTIASITGQAAITGIVSGSGAQQFRANTVRGLTTTGGSAVMGISITGGAAHSVIFNKIGNLEANNSGGSVIGVNLTSGTTITVANNLIGDLRTPIASGANTIIGINVNGPTAANVYFNTVHLNGTSSGTNFGSSAFFGATGTTIDLRNNVFSNTSVSNGTGLSVAYRRSGTGLANFAATSNRNDFIAPVIFYDGTNSDMTIGAYQTRVTPRDANSFSQAPNFMSTVAANTSFLHVDVTIPTMLESAGTNIAGITTDFDGDIRQGNGGYTGTGTAPDVGADEFEPAIVNCATASGGTLTTTSESVCAGGTKQMTVTGATNMGGITYQWKVSNTPGGPYANVTGGIGATTTSYTSDAALTAGTYYFVMETTCSFGPVSALSNEFTLTVNPTPVVNVTPSSGMICLPGGSAVALSAAGATTYAWSPATGLSATNVANVTANPTVTTTYSVVGTSAGCNSAATPVTITVNNNPVISSVTATPAAVCDGSNSQLVANASVAYNNTAAAYSFTGSTDVYTPITGTTLGSGVIGDDVGIGNLPIGFSFPYNGTSFTVFGARSNGLIELGQTTVSLTGFSSNSLSGNANCIAALWDDNNTTGGSVIYSTTGTAPNRVLTVQWTGMHVGGSGSSTNPTIDCQVQLFETTGVIKLIYGTTSAALSGTTASIGISGAVGNYKSVTPLAPANTSTVSSSSENTGISAATNFPSGTVYTFTPPPAPVLTYAWSPSTFLSSTTIANPVATAVNAPASYTVVVTTSNGCSATGNVALTVNPVPTAPTGVNSAQCGTQIPTASVTSTTGVPTPTFVWYDALSGGNLVQSSTSNTFTSNVSVTTTFGVAELNASGCESTRIPVTVTVATADPVSATISSATICLGASVDLNSTNLNPTPVQTYTYSWSSTAGSGITAPLSGAAQTITPTATGNYTYTVTAVDGGCSAVNTVALTVNENPVAVVSGVSDNSICNGELVDLTSSVPSSAIVLAQNFDAGLGGWTTTFNGTAPASTGFMIQNAPFTYDGTMDFTNFATPQGGGFVMSNADMGSSGNKTRSTVVSPVFSTMGLVNGTLTFQNLYQKFASGDSLVRLEISTDGGTSWATLKDYLPLGSQGTTTNNAQVPANESITLTAPYLNQPNMRIRFNYVSAWGFMWLIDDVKISGTTDMTLAWTSAPAGFTSTLQNPTGVAPTVSTTYTITVTNPVGCTSTSSVAVTVNQPSSSSVTASSCDSYTWAQNGTTYTASGAYTAVVPNAAGCDSTITLNLTINNSTTATVPHTACDTYTWPINGQTYTTSGTYTATISNAAGCDSVITLNLTINQPTSATVNHTACQTYTWPINGQTYTTSGVYTATIPNAANCDSVITLNLTIGGPSASSVTVTECLSYTWAQNGMTYTASGAYTDTIPNMFGCDSVITLNLTINQPTTSTVTETECTSYTWAQNGMTYTTSGMYNDTIANAAGCDSIITLDLTIIQPTTSTVSVTECSSYTWAQNGMTYTTSGMYTDTIQNAAGCDSVITLNLTINVPTSSVFTVSTCSPSYTWAQNGTVYNTSGMYNDTILNAAGCDSVVTLNLTITNFVATATDNGDATITASAGTTYQWINCTTNTPIAGATAQTFAATANGTYAVIVSNGTCSDTSNCVNITNVGIKENTISTISVHPNPTHDVVIVTMDASSAIVEVMDVQGKLVQTTQIKSGDQIDLGTYERGVYTLRIKTESGTSIERIVKN
jgi:hypothetical protein